MKINKLETEWCLLQNQYDSYEKHSLYIKLLSVVVVLVAVVSDAASSFIALLLLVLWLQDAIWKTFQSRIEPRLLQLEQSILQHGELQDSELQDCELQGSKSQGIELKSNVAGAFQFNSEYYKVRFTGLSLIKEYIGQSVRPTVAFPYLVLILILVVKCWF